MRSLLFACRFGIMASFVMALCLLSHASLADPAAVVTAFDDQTRKMLKDVELTPVDRLQRFHALVDEAFNFPVIAHYVLGRYWQSTADDVRQEFTRVFEDYAIEAYTRRLNEYGGKPASVMGERAESQGITIVTTKLALADGDEPTTVEWRVETTTNGLKITDVIVAGVSMALSYREQFAAAIQRNGGRVAALTSELKGKLAVKISDAASSKQ
ncbi:MAG TPA: ABC transporter substrate-binding protein [Stellaceae bacterium]|nr:ABC transporter substrate-binding protein [Stellaceae bacterium]